MAISPSGLPTTRSRGPRPSPPGTRARPCGKPPFLRAAVDVVVVGFGGVVAGLQPVIRPSGPSTAALGTVSLNMNSAGTGPSPFPWSMRKREVGLKTMPVGAEAVTSNGTLTTGSSARVAPRYSVTWVSRVSGAGMQSSDPQSEAGLKLLFTQIGVVGPKAIPHGFLTLLSSNSAL